MNNKLHNLCILPIDAHNIGHVTNYLTCTAGSIRKNDICGTHINKKPEKIFRVQLTNNHHLSNSIHSLLLKFLSYLPEFS